MKFHHIIDDPLITRFSFDLCSPRANIDADDRDPRVLLDPRFSVCIASPTSEPRPAYRRLEVVFGRPSLYFGCNDASTDARSIDTVGGRS